VSYNPSTGAATVALDYSEGSGTGITPWYVVVAGAGANLADNTVTSAKIVDGTIVLGDVNTAQIQARLTGSCAPGSSVRSVDATGAVICEPDDNTVYTAGAGLALVGTTFSAANGGITSAMIADGTITSADILDGSIATADILDGTVGSADINTAQVQARVGACGAGTSIRSIDATGAVTCEVDDNTTYTAGAGLTLVGTTFSVPNGGITGAMIADGTIASADVLDNSLGAIDLAPNAAGSDEIFGTTYGILHHGATGLGGQAAGWQPSQWAGTPGVWLENSASEGGGFYADGDAAVIYSAGDQGLLRIHDEDYLGLGNAWDAGLRFGFDMFTYGGVTSAIWTWTGAYLSSAGVWTNNSDRNAKENLVPVDSQQILERVAGLPVYEYSYKIDSTRTRHVGPMAQDFYAAFGGLGADSTAIPTIDADGVSLAALKALYQRNEDLRRQNEALQVRVQRLEELMQPSTAR
jgi:hypothetical protein